jgi:hypothetical protein
MAARESQSSEQMYDKVQLGVRMNRRLVKVLKATAEYLDLPLVGLLENMAVANLQGECAFSPEVQKQARRFSKIYGFDELLEVGDEEELGDEDES